MSSRILIITSLTFVVLAVMKSTATSEAEKLAIIGLIVGFAAFMQVIYDSEVRRG